MNPLSNLPIVFPIQITPPLIEPSPPSSTVSELDHKTTLAFRRNCPVILPIQIMPPSQAPLPASSPTLQKYLDETFSPPKCDETTTNNIIPNIWIIKSLTSEWTIQQSIHFLACINSATSVLENPECDITLSTGSTHVLIECFSLKPEILHQWLKDQIEVSQFNEPLQNYLREVLCTGELNEIIEKSLSLHLILKETDLRTTRSAKKYSV